MWYCAVAPEEETLKDDSVRLQLLNPYNALVKTKHGNIIHDEASGYSDRAPRNSADFTIIANCSALTQPSS